MKKFKLLRIIVVLALIGVFIAVKMSPSIAIWLLSDRIDQLGGYIYDSEEKERNDQLYYDPYKLNNDLDVPKDLKTLLIVGCDQKEGGIPGCYGADIAILVTSQNSGEIHIYSLDRDLPLRISNNSCAKLTDVCRNYQPANFIDILKMNLNVPINNYIMIQSKDDIVEKVFETFAPEGLEFELNQIELIGLNQILLNTLSNEEKEQEVFRDSNGNILGKAEIDKLSTASEFIGFYTLPNSDTKVFPASNGEPLPTDENGTPVSVPVTDLVMYIECLPSTEDQDTENLIEYNGKYYTICMNKDGFISDAYSAYIYDINNIFDTNYSNVKKTVTLSPKQIQAFSRLRHSYLDQGISRNENVKQILSKLAKFYAKNPKLFLEKLNSETTEAFFKEAGETKAIRTSCTSISSTFIEMYPQLAPIQLGSYANIDGEVIHITYIPDPYHPLSEASLKTQMHWAIYGN